MFINEILIYLILFNLIKFEIEGLEDQHENPIVLENSTEIKKENASMLLINDLVIIAKKKNPKTHLTRKTLKLTSHHSKVTVTPEKLKKTTHHLIKNTLKLTSHHSKVTASDRNFRGTTNKSEKNISIIKPNDSDNQSNDRSNDNSHILKCNLIELSYIKNLIALKGKFIIHLNQKLILFDNPKLIVNNKTQDFFYTFNKPQSFLIDDDLIYLNDEIKNYDYKGYFMDHLGIIQIFRKGDDNLYERIEILSDDEKGKNNISLKATKIDADKEVNAKLKIKLNVTLKYDFFVAYAFENILIWFLYNYDKMEIRREKNITGRVVEENKEYKNDYRVINVSISYGNELNEIILIELDEMNYFHLNYININDQLNKSNWRTTHNISLSSLLNCHSKFTHFNQLKGIHFDSNRLIFYVFIDKFYLKFDDEDLVKNLFNIKNDLYEKKAIDLKFNSNNPSKIKFGEPNLNWAKKLGPKFYFFFGQQYFDVNYDQKNELELIEKSKEDLFVALSMQTIIIDECYGEQLLIKNKFVFCFHGYQYYLIGQKKDDNSTNLSFEKQNIKDMFNGTNINYDDNDVIKFIFNYIHNQFVLMTISSIYIIDYRLINLDEKKMILNLNPINQRSERIFKFKNCLFNYCNDTLSPKKDDKKITKKIVKILKNTIDKYYIILALFSVSLVTAFIYSIRSNKLQKKISDNKSQNSSDKDLLKIKKIKSLSTITTRGSLEDFDAKISILAKFDPSNPIDLLPDQKNTTDEKLIKDAKQITPSIESIKVNQI